MPLFRQLYVICAVVNGALIPAVYCLLPTKEHDMYATVYRHLLAIEVKSLEMFELNNLNP